MKKPNLIYFKFIKESMQTRTKKAQLLKLGNVKNPILLWLPLSHITIEECADDLDYNFISMPEWLLKKNIILATYVEIYPN